jgi:hypothetical protein
MVSADTDWSSGATGMAFDAEIAARLRPMANADAARIFTGFPFLLLCNETTIPNYANTATTEPPIASPAMTAPVMAVPAMAAPSPMTPVPVPMPVVAPADLFGLEAIHLVCRGHGGMDV